MAEGAEGGIYHDEDEEEGKGDDEGEALVGFLLEFIGAAPGGEGSGWEFDLLFDGGFGLGDKAADIASGNVGLNGDEALAVFAGDLAGADEGLEGGDFVEWDEGAFGAADDGLADGFWVVAVLWGVADEDVKASDAFKDESGAGAADTGLNDVLDVGDVEVVTCGGGAVDLDEELGGTGDLIDLDIAGAFDFTEDGRDLVGVMEEGVEVFAEDFEGEFCLDAFEEFVDGHFDGLGIIDDDARGMPDGFAEGFDHGFGIVGDAPFGGGSHEEVEFRGVDGVGVGTDFAAPDAGDDLVDFGDFEEASLDGLGHVSGGVDGDGGCHLEFDDEGAFVEARGEFGAEARDESEAEGEDEEGGEAGETRACDEGGKDSAVGVLEAGRAWVGAVFVFWGPHTGMGDDGADEERVEEGAGHGEGDGVSEGAEGFALDSGEGEEGEEDEDDDGDREPDGAGDLEAGLDDGFGAGEAGLGAEVLVDVLGHDDGTIDEHSDCDGDSAEGHEIGGDPEVIHSEGGKEDGEGEGEGDDDGGSPTAHKEGEGKCHEGDALKEGVGDGADRGFNEGFLFVVRDDLNAFGEAFVDFLDFVFDCLNDGGGVRAEEFDDLPGDDFADSVVGLKAAADRLSFLDAGDFPDRDRGAIETAEENGAEVLDSGGEADGTDDVFLVVLFDVLSADVEVVGFEGVDDIGDGEGIAFEGEGIDLDVKLFFVAADAEDFGDAGDVLEVEFNDPILNGAQLGEGIGSGGVLEVIEEDLPHAGGDGAHFGLSESGGDIFAGFVEAFPHQLATEVDVHAVLEIHIYDREPEV